MARLPISSLAINDEKASHKIVGSSEKFGYGIIGFYDRLTVVEALAAIREADPSAKLIVEPHNDVLSGKALRSTDVQWIIEQHGEIGVKIGDQFFFLYKGESVMPTNQVLQYRHIEKRELGETFKIQNMKDYPEDFRDVGEWLQMDLRYSNNEAAYSN